MPSYWPELVLTTLSLLANIAASAFRDKRKMRVKLFPNHGDDALAAMLLLKRRLPWIFYFYFLSEGRILPIRFMDCMDCTVAWHNDPFMQGAAIEQLRPPMKILRTRRFCILLLVMNAHFFQGIEKTVAETPTDPVADVALDPSGNLFCCSNAEHISGPLQIHLMQNGRQIAESQFKTEGAVVFTGLRPGAYQIHWGRPNSGYRTKVVRLWKHEQAPPSARDFLALEQIKSVVIRGQYGGEGGGGSEAPSGMGRIFRNPWISAGIISAAIAIPIAVYYDDYDAS